MKQDFENSKLEAQWEKSQQTDIEALNAL